MYKYYKISSIMPRFNACSAVIYHSFCSLRTLCNCFNCISVFSTITSLGGGTGGSNINPFSPGGNMLGAPGGSGGGGSFVSFSTSKSILSSPSVKYLDVRNKLSLNGKLEVFASLEKPSEFNAQSFDAFDCGKRTVLQ